MAYRVECIMCSVLHRISPWNFPHQLLRVRPASAGGVAPASYETARGIYLRIGARVHVLYVRGYAGIWHAHEYGSAYLCARHPLRHHDHALESVGMRAGRFIQINRTTALPKRSPCLGTRSSRRLEGGGHSCRDSCRSSRDLRGWSLYCIELRPVAAVVGLLWSRPWRLVEGCTAFPPPCLAKGVNETTTVSTGAVVA
jgi:hypothetical protein